MSYQHQDSIGYEIAEVLTVARTLTLMFSSVLKA